MRFSLPATPILDALPALRAALRAHRNAVLEAPPGAGKSTVVPLALLGEFTIDGSRTLDDFGKLYGVPIPEGSGGLTIASYLAEKLATLPTVGDRVRMGPIDLIVKTVENDRILDVGIDLEPERPPEGMERWARITRMLREGFRFRHHAG